MDWNAITAKFDRVRAGDTDVQKKIRGLRRRLTLLLAVVGPGLITSNVDNDAGGISVYTQAGAKYGYALLWSLIPMTMRCTSRKRCARAWEWSRGKGFRISFARSLGFGRRFL